MRSETLLFAALFIQSLITEVWLDKFTKVTWSRVNLSYRSSVRVFTIIPGRGHVTECASLCERSGLYNCQLFAIDQNSHCVLLKMDLSNTWPDLGFKDRKVFERTGSTTIVISFKTRQFISFVLF